MNIRAPILAALSALALASCGFADGDPMQTARDAYAERDYRTARVALASVVSGEAVTPEALDLYARTLLELEDGESAQRVLANLAETANPPADIGALFAHASLLQQDFEQALAQADAASDHPLAQWVAVQSLGRLSRDEEAYARADSAIEQFPDDARLLALRGAIALTQRRSSEAKEYAERALEADPENFDALMLAGQLRVMHGDYAEAREFYSTATSEHPANINGIFAIAAIEADLGEYDTARDHLDRLLEVAPEHPMALLLKARIAFNEGDLNEANTIVQQAEAQIGQLPQGRLLLGEIAYLRGFPAQAISHLENFLRSWPGHIHASTILARALDEEGDPQAAWAIAAPLADSATATPQLLSLASDLAGRLGEEDRFAARISASRPQDYGDNARAAQRALTGGEAEEAERLFAALIENGARNDPVILNNAAHAALGVGNASEALRRARLAYELAPQDPRVMDTLGWMMLENGQASPALTHLTRAVEAQPGNLQIRWHYANALIANGRNAEARRIVSELREFAQGEQREAMDALLARL